MKESLHSVTENIVLDDKDIVSSTKPRVAKEIREHALREIRKQKLLAEKLLATYETLVVHGPMTGDDLDAFLGSTGPHGHVSAFNWYGLTKKVGKKRSPVTGKSSWLIDVTGKIPDPHPSGKPIGYNTYQNDSASRKQKPDDPINKGEDESGRKAWNKLREMVQAYYMTRLKGVDDFSRDQFSKKLDIDLDTIRSLANSRLSNILKETPDPTRSKLHRACRVLGLKEPRRNQQIDLKDARRKMHQFARQYHPDVNSQGGDMYRRIVNAFQIIETFVLGNNKEENNE